jgi:XTP/dITP diphosphohydrolase/tetrapyrrole methylase family protein/MazG family protein/ATP diphosphatase
VPPPDRQAALLALDDLTRRLRRECPWDREQDERSIVPHTVEEAYELADAAQRGDDAKMLDELGDVLFQVHFLSLLLEERGAGDLAAVAEHCRQKLIRRHPHVFGEPPRRPEGAELSQNAGPDAPRSKPLSAGEVLRNWDDIKRGEQGREPGIFADVPENLPALLLARKVQRRAASSGFDFPDAAGPAAEVREELAEVEAAETREERFHEVGDLLFAAAAVARKLRVDPELALRDASERFRARVERAEAAAAAEGHAWRDLEPQRRLAYYDRPTVKQGDSET